MLCAIVPFSTSEPRKILPCHMKLRFDPVLPAPYDAPEMWVKGDIVLTVAFHRLRLLFSGWEGGQRNYDVRILPEETMNQVRDCVRFGLGL